MTLTDTQLVLLSAAAQRDDYLIALPDRLKGGAAKAVVSKLLAHKLVEETAVGRDDPHWRTGDDRGCLIGLKLTRTGLQAIGVESEGQGAEPLVGPAHDNMDIAPPTALKSTTAREGSKRALVISLLSRDAGATLDDLVQATGWQPHTTRAALTGLRQRGYELARTKDGVGRSVYRMKLAPEPPRAAQPTAVEA